LTNEILFERTCDLYLSLQVSNHSGISAGALVALAASAINITVTDHIVAAQRVIIIS
jgi:hypothetical protein